MAKKKRQKYIRIVKTKGNNWAFKTELGIIIATFLSSFAFLSLKLTGNAVADVTSETVSILGAILFVLGIVELFIFVGRRKR